MGYLTDTDSMHNSGISYLLLLLLMGVGGQPFLLEAQNSKSVLAADLERQQLSVDNQGASRPLIELAVPKISNVPQSSSSSLSDSPSPTSRGATTLAADNLPIREQWQEQGLASWYAGRFQGRTTANGETFDTNSLTAAHKSLPFNSVVEVYNPTNERSVVVRINDRGPFVEGRIIDLSRAAASTLGITTNGVSEVYLRVVKAGESQKDQLHLIQIGSFAQHKNALDLIQDLRLAGFNPAIESQNDTIFRVIIPNIPHRQIQHYQKQLQEAGYADVLVRQKQP